MAVIIKGSIGKKDKAVKVTSKWTNQFAKTSGKKSSNRGRPTGFKLSKATRAKISQAQLGHTVSKETRKKTSNSLKEYNSKWRSAGYSKHWIWVHKNDKKALKLVRGEL